MKANSFSDWGRVYQTNVAAVFFMTMAFLPLLTKGAKDGRGHNSSVINISSIWGQSKLNYGVVCLPSITQGPPSWTERLLQFPYSISKAACTQLTYNLATDFSLRKIPVRVNAISPGTFPSELAGTRESITAVAKTNILGTLTPSPAGRPGQYVSFCSHSVATLYLITSTSPIATKKLQL